MSLHVANLTHRQRNTLPSWIQQIYEPWSMILSGTWIHGLGGWTDQYLIRGRLLISLFLPLCVYTLGKRYHPTIWFIAAICTGLSFIQYNVYRRAYRKQLIGISLVCILLAYYRRVSIWAIIPLALIIIATNRAAGILLMIIVAIYIVYVSSKYIYEKRNHTAISYSIRYIQKLCLWSIVVWSGLLFLYRQVMDEQIRRLIEPFLSAIDVPTMQDSYQQSGTFLTVWEYIQVSRYTLIPWVLWLARALYSRSYMYISLPSLVLVIWVFGQWFFFQRMIWYLDIFMILCMSIGVYESIKHTKQYKTYIWILCLVLTSAAYMLYWWEKIWWPLILPEEYQTIQNLWEEIEYNAVVIVPGIWYSPWISGWMDSATVIAPGLFDHQQRGTLDQWWTTKRLDQVWTIKCKNRSRDFPELEWRPTYIRHGSKQQDDIYIWDESCIELVYDAWLWQWYQMSDNF